MRLSLYENYRFLLYAPFYAAHATGAYQAAGIEVDLLPSPGPGKAEQALIEGAVDVIWAGPMRVIKHHDDHPDSPLVCFAEVVARDPFSIVGRTANPGFRLSELAGLRFASVSEVPTPWLCLQQDLREAGLDPSRLDRVADRSMADNLAALRDGRLDAVQLFEPMVEVALTGGAGHVWHQASRRGRTSYTAFVTTRTRLSQQAEPLRRLVRAIHRIQQWLAAASPPAIADAVAPYFPSLDRVLLSGAITRYRDQQVWGGDPILPEAGFDRLRRGLVSSGFVRRTIPFADCVDNTLARQATEPMQ
jgi:NitT/TauT family transport system substrate-binding protein